MDVFVIGAVIFLLAAIMTMTGRGGGNFYVLTFVLFGIEMRVAASLGQFVLFLSSFVAMLVFGKKKSVEWRLVFLIGVVASLFAFLGGFFSTAFNGKTLKVIFAFFLFLAGISMLLKREGLTFKDGRFTYLVKSPHGEFKVNLLIALPVIAITGFVAGMVGVSGGSFFVPLMVVACNVPMKIAVGTSSTLLFGTAFFGFLGHVLSHPFPWKEGIIFALFGMAGGFLGSHVAFKTNPFVLKVLFAATTILAAFLVLFKTLGYF